MPGATPGTQIGIDYLLSRLRAAEDVCEALTNSKWWDGQDCVDWYPELDSGGDDVPHACGSCEYCKMHTLHDEWEKVAHGV